MSVKRIYDFENKIFFMKNPNLHSVAFAIYFELSMFDQPVSGINHLAEHLFTCFENNDKKKEFYQNFEKLGVDFISTTMSKGIYFSYSCLPENFEKSLVLIKDLLLERTFSKEAFLTEKAIISAEILNSYHDDYSFCLSYSHLPILGDEESLNSITFPQASEYMKDIFCKRNAYIFLAGNYSNLHESLIKSLYDFLPNRDKILKTKKIEASRIEKINFKHFKDDSIDIKLAFDCSKVHFEEIDILNMMLLYPGSGILTFILREKLGLIYDLDSNILVDNEKYILVCKITIKKNQLLKTIHALSNALESLNNLLTEDLLRCCLPFRTCNLDFLYDNPLLWINHCINNFDKGIMSIEEEKSKYNSITINDLIKYSNDISFDNCFFMFEGDLTNKEKKQLNRLLCKNEFLETESR